MEKEFVSKEKLELIKKLKDNWNGYGAKPINKIILDYTEKLLDNILVQPKIFPTAANSIQLEYYDKNNQDNCLIIELRENDINIFNNITNESLFFSYENFIEKVNESIEEFYQKRDFIIYYGKK